MAGRRGGMPVSLLASLGGSAGGRSWRACTEGSGRGTRAAALCLLCRASAGSGCCDLALGLPFRSNVSLSPLRGVRSRLSLRSPLCSPLRCVLWLLRGDDRESSLSLREVLGDSFPSLPLLLVNLDLWKIKHIIQWKINKIKSIRHKQN